MLRLSLSLLFLTCAAQAEVAADPKAVALQAPSTLIPAALPAVVDLDKVCDLEVPEAHWEWFPETKHSQCDSAQITCHENEFLESEKQKLRAQKKQFRVVSKVYTKGTDRHYRVDIEVYIKRWNLTDSKKQEIRCGKLRRCQAQLIKKPEQVSYLNLANSNIVKECKWH